jgi:hypothetical protein
MDGIRNVRLRLALLPPKRFVLASGSPTAMSPNRYGWPVALMEAGVFQRLFGPRKKDARAADLGIIAQLQKLGADLRQPRDTVVYLYFKTEDGAKVAADQLRLHEFDAKVRPAAAGKVPWAVIANRDYVVNSDSIQELSAIAEQAARAGDGEYDGWEAAARP